MKKNTTRFLAIALALVMALGVLAACSNDQPAVDPAAPNTPTSPGTPNSPAPPPPPPPGEEQILRFGTTGVDGRFAPIMSNNIYDAYVSQLVFEPLAYNNAEGAFVPILADWTVSADALTYTFTLKDGITFSDGTPLTTADVAFTYRSMSHPDYDGPRSYVVADMLGYDEFRAGSTTNFPGVRIVDAKVIEFTFKDGTASPANIQSFIYGIMPEHIFAFNSWNDFLDMNSSPLGSGKFVLDDYRPMEYVRLSKNPNYWNPADAPKIDGVLMLDVPEESLQNAFLSGQIDLAQPATTIDNYNDFSAMSIAQPLVHLDNGYQFMCFNTLRPQLSDVRVRQALMYSLPRQAYVDIMLGPLGSVGLAPISPASWAFPDSGMNDYALDLAKAEELFAEAGWVKGSDGVLAKDGVRMAISWLVYTDAPWPGILSELAFDSWRQVGVELNIEIMDFNTVSSRTMEPPPEDKDFDIYTMGFSLSIDPDPSGALFDYDAYVEGGFNASGYYNERAQELIRLGKTEFDQARRTAIYHEWAQLMNEEIPTVIVAYRYMLWAVSNRVQGLGIDVYWDWTQDISNITLS